jgi:hypothetical protein
MTEQQRYRVYLLRVWQADDNGRLVWRAALEDARTGERHGFANLARLYAFLEQQTDDWARRDIRPPEDTT